MVQIHSKSDEFPLEHIKLKIDDPDLYLAKAREMAKVKARELFIKGRLVNT